MHAARQIVAIYIRAYHNTDYLAALDLIDHYAPRTIQGEQDECSLSERTGQEIMVKIKLRGAIREGMAAEMADLRHGASNA